jgi:hypothetical protein
MKEYPRLGVSSYTFDIDCYQAEYRIDHRTLQDSGKVTALIDEVTKDVVIRCKMYMATTILQKNIAVVFDDKYVTWWDHFKATELPTFTRWFRLKINTTRETKQINFTRKALFPDIPIDDNIIKKGRVIIQEAVVQSFVNPGE